MVERHRPVTGWLPMDSGWWPVVAASLQKPWPAEAIMMDLRWWADQERMGRARRPGRPTLRKRWGVPDRAARSAMKDDAAWACPIHGASSERPASVQRQSSASPAATREKLDNGAETSSVSPASVQRQSSARPHARRDQKTEDRRQRPEEGESVGSATESLPGIDPPPQPNPETLPDWLGKERRIPAASRSRFLDLVMKAHQMVRGEVEGGILSLAPPGSPKRMKTFSGHVAALWKATGADNVEEFGRDLLLVIDAAKRCPDPLFARDIRAEGWAEGVDRSGEIETICRHTKWDSRIEAARKWKRGGSNPASPATRATNGSGHRSGAQAIADMIAAKNGRRFADAELEVINVEEVSHGDWR